MDEGLYVYMNTYVCVYIYICIYLYVYIYIYTYICMYVYIYNIYIYMFVYVLRSLHTTVLYFEIVAATFLFSQSQLKLHRQETHWTQRHGITLTEESDTIYLQIHPESEFASIKQLKLGGTASISFCLGTIRSEFLIT